MAINARVYYDRGTISTGSAVVSASYVSHGRIEIKVRRKGSIYYTVNSNWRLEGSSTQTQRWNWFCSTTPNSSGRFYAVDTRTFVHNVSANGTYRYRVVVDQVTARVKSGYPYQNVNSRLTYGGTSDWVEVTVNDFYVPKVIKSADVVEVSRNSRPALQINNAVNTDGSTQNIQVNVNGTGWQNYYNGITFTQFAPGTTITVQVRNSDTPGTVITKNITLSYGIQPTSKVSVASVIQNTCDCITSNSNGSYTISKREWSVDNQIWTAIVGQSFSITGLQYNTDYTVYYKTTFTENISSTSNSIVSTAEFKTPLPMIEHSISAIDIFKHLEDKSGTKDTARFELVLKEGITLQTIFLGIQEYSDYTYDEENQELIVNNLEPNTIYTITAFATNDMGEGEYATIKFQTNGQIFDSLLEDPTSGNHLAPLTFIHNVYNNDFTRTQEDINEDFSRKIEELSGIGGPINAIDFMTEFGTNEPTQVQLTEAFAKGVWGDGGVFTEQTPLYDSTYVIDGVTHYAKDLFSSTWVRNTATGERWVLTNTQDTDPIVFNISNVGIDTVSIFTNQQAGIIKGSDSEGSIKANLDGTGTVNGYSTLKSNVSTNTSNINANTNNISELQTKVTDNTSDIQELQTSVGNLQTSNGNKVDKTTEPNKLYGTDSSGEQTLYDLSSAGGEGQPKSTLVYSLGNENGSWTQMTQEQQDALNSGITSTKVTSYDSVANSGITQEKVQSYDNLVDNVMSPVSSDNKILTELESAYNSLLNGPESLADGLNPGDTFNGSLSDGINISWSRDGQNIVPALLFLDGGSVVYVSSVLGQQVTGTLVVKVTSGGSPVTPTNMVTTDTAQSITGVKTFANGSLRSENVFNPQIFPAMPGETVINKTILSGAVPTIVSSSITSKFLVEDLTSDIVTTFTTEELKNKQALRSGNVVKLFGSVSKIMIASGGDQVQILRIPGISVPFTQYCIANNGATSSYDYFLTVRNSSEGGIELLCPPANYEQIFYFDATIVINV